MRLRELVLACTFSSAALAQPAPEPTPPPPTEPTPAPVPTEPGPAPAPVAPAPAPAPVPVAPAPPPAAPGYAPAYGPPPPAAPPPRRIDERLENHLVIPVFKMGGVIDGGGDIEYDCKESGTPIGTCPSSVPNLDYEDEAGVALGADLLFRAGSGLRLGLGSLVILDPKYKVEFQGFSDEVESGLEASLFGVVEGVFPVSDTVGLTLRGQLGLTALFVGEDHADAIDENRDACDQGGADVCELNEGPLFGPHVGVGFGVLFDVGSVAFRVELLGQAVRYPLWRSKISEAGTTTEVEQDVVGTRSLLLVGFEL